MTSKVRIKMGPIEVDYEGSEEFLKEELVNLLTSVSKLYKESGMASAVLTPDSGGAGSGSGAAKTVQGTSATIAAKLGVDSGPDLVMAACARLTFVLRKQAFSRKEILEEMKTASGYYKKSYSNNLSTYLQGLVSDGKLLETSTDNYSLNSPTKSNLEERLARS
jgi:hypothetical protein